ncbi:DUF1266 domain-containing protein [Streptomyces sp. NBC_00654]|uniref:DUF1266 domain-containing protein n=1 Tax=Streptomyces sp. NBC_00654 TaxID=2975799 RepID=UPI0022584CD2|nr:DUF1266 domain-containing protein [Streptomyces sp. NBC_00654]MCX4964747.1 DUF1266 domain-containing protein [Streptomyces sp. NBC_00654]
MERELYEATSRGGADAVLDALSRTPLYVLVPRLHADTPGFTAPLPSFHDPATGRICVPVLTPGMLPPWHPEWVFRRTRLAELALAWPRDRRWLSVNHGTPYAALVEARTRHHRAWLKADARSGGPRAGRLLTLGGGALHGPLAHGLALGAHLALHNGLVWNQLGAVYEDYPTDKARLRSPWGIHHRADYRERLDSLMRTRLVGRVHETVLRTRSALATRLGRTPSHQEWSEAVTGTPAARRADAEDLAEAREALRRIVRYEDLFRAEGFLAPDDRVDTLAAFDHGRAVNVVRLALGARFCEPAEAEQAVLRIGVLARRAYGSWADFSLGYCLTRLIHFDEDEGTGHTVQESLAQHRILTQDPTSPYRNIPWS